jgi:2-succinyl-5-enolpyruvyl-6-hydroxy-3-cyclohexene-1-carboxylate synthase
VSHPRNPATALSRVLVDELVRCGVRDLVLAPGSRSAALAFAAHRAAEQGALRLHVRVDERTAGFLALGLARTSRRPVPVVTTSGTAVANLHPAVLEASHAGLPLLVISADRPAHLRGTGANQTTDQVKLFGDAVRAFADLPAPTAGGPSEASQVPAWRSLVARLVATASGSTPAAAGPVHLNVQLAEPMTPDADAGWSSPVDGRPDGAAWTDVVRPADGPGTTLPLGPRTVVVAGDDAGPPARIQAEQAGWPLLAEPSSGSRTGPNAIRTYRLLLAYPDLADRVERVVVCGHPTLSRPVSRLLARPDVEVVAAAGATGWTDAGHRVSRVVEHPRAAGADDRSWLEAWQERDAAVGEALDRLLEKRDGLAPHDVAGAVSRALPARGLLFVGASNPVRDLDLMVPRYPVGERRLVVANRGLAGIDGTLSSAIGAALGRDHSSRAFALVGDVTFLHDANALVLGPDEPRPDLMVVVVNDDGGSIFATLEQGGEAHAASFERLFGTPHRVDLAALCAATRTPHRRVIDREQLAAALAAPVGGIEVVEAVVRRDDRRALDAAVRGLVQQARSSPGRPVR